MMQWLRGWLILVGLVQVSAVVAVFMPKEWIDYCSQLMRVEPLPNVPLAGYLARLSSAMYVVHGMVHLAIAWKLPRSMELVVPAGSISIALGAMMFYVDCKEGMPFGWTVLEVVTILSVGFVTIALGIFCKSSPPSVHGETTNLKHSDSKS